MVFLYLRASYSFMWATVALVLQVNERYLLSNREIAGLDADRLWVFIVYRSPD
jgi:hypothetical protein